MDRADVVNFVVRAKEMRELAGTIKSEQRRKLLLENQQRDLKWVGKRRAPLGTETVERPAFAGAITH